MRLTMITLLFACGVAAAMPPPVASADPVCIQITVTDPHTGESHGPLLPECIPTEYGNTCSNPSLEPIENLKIEVLLCLPRPIGGG